MTHRNPSRHSAMTDSDHESGFSLLEVILVMAIAMVLMGFAIPVILSSIRNTTLSSAATNMARMTQLARMKAIQQGSNTSVRLVVSGGRDLFGADADCDGLLGNTEQAYVLPVGVSLSADAPPPTDTMNFSSAPTTVVAPFDITFNSRGNKIVSCADTTISVAPSLIHVTGWGNSNAVTVSGAGRARSWQYEGGSWR